MTGVPAETDPVETPPTHDGTGRVQLSFTPSERAVRVPPGVTVFDAASWNGIAIDSTCGGHGTCKKCKVQVVDGSVPVSNLDVRAAAVSGVLIAGTVIVATLMERLVADITPSANKVYIRINRFLADRNVLPDIKAALRAKSDLWPEDDKDLLPAFSRLMSEAGPLPTDIVIPPRLTWPGVARLDLRSTAAFWVVFDERDDAICVEPQTAPPDAFNLAAAIGVDPPMATPDRPASVATAWRWEVAAPPPRPAARVTRSSAKPATPSKRPRSRRAR